MLVTMRQKDFESFDDVSLIWACIEPTIQQVRGRNFTIKTEVYTTLTPGQRALLMFQMLYGHTTNGIEAFFSHLTYLLTNKGVWSQLKKGMEYFEDYDMIQILDKMNAVFQGLNRDEFIESAEQNNVLIADVDQSVELKTEISLLNKSLMDTIPLSINRVATYIRNNINEFVQIVD
jgi:hypothetical protein